MGRSTRRRGVFITLLAAALLLLCVGTASAHNSFVRSKPADGANLETLPKRVSLTFAKAVPLDTIQVVLVQASGARVDAKGFRHGPGGEQEVVVPTGSSRAGPADAAVAPRQLGRPRRLGSGAARRAGASGHRGRFQQRGGSAAAGDLGAPGSD